jgi:hypothetical protein
MLLPVGILAGLGIQGMLDWLQARTSPTAVAAAIAVVALLPVETLLEPINNTPIASWRERLSAVRAKLPEPVPEDAILFVTSNADGRIHSELDAMLLAQELGIATLNGYSGNEPPGNVTPLTCTTAKQRLSNYALYRNLPLEAIAPMVARTVTLEQQACTEDHPRIMRTRRIDPEIAPRIGLSVTDIHRVGGRVTASIALENRSNYRLPSLAQPQSALISFPRK